MDKKPIFRVGDYVALTTPRYVYYCGYEFTHVDALHMVYKECFNEKDFTPNLATEPLKREFYYKEGYYRTAKDRQDMCRRIFDNHPDFAHIREAAKPLHKALGSLRWQKCPEFDEDDSSTWYSEELPRNKTEIFYAFRNRLVKDYVYMRMSHKIQSGNRRLLKKEEIKTDLREGFWEVTGKKVVQTGKYYPPTHYSGYDEPSYTEPGGLTDPETHVLLECQMRTFDYKHNIVSAYTKDQAVFLNLIHNGKMISFNDGWNQGSGHKCWLDRDDCYHIYPDADSREAATIMMHSA